MSGQKDETAVDQAAHEAAVATARTEGTNAGRQAERERITAIIGSDAAKDRPKAALSAALKTDMSVEQATAFLADLPAEKSEAASTETPAPAAANVGVGNRFDQAMDSTGNPNLGSQEAGQPSRAARALSLAGTARQK